MILENSDSSLQPNAWVLPNDRLCLICNQAMWTILLWNAVQKTLHQLLQAWLRRRRLSLHFHRIQTLYGVLGRAMHNLGNQNPLFD